MTAVEPAPTSAALDWLAVPARWLIGVLFIYMGLHKALDPVGFLKLVHEYRMIGNPILLNSVAAALPWFEVFCGLLLVAGVAVRGTALMLVLMLVPFTLAILRRALSVVAAQHLSFWAVKFDCGCGTGEVIIWKKLLENSLLILLACGLLSGRGRRLCARFALLGGR